MKLTFVKMGIIFSATNLLELQENKMPFKSALSKYLLTHVFYYVEEFLLHNDTN